MLLCLLDNLQKQAHDGLSIYGIIAKNAKICKIKQFPARKR